MDTNINIDALAEPEAEGGLVQPEPAPEETDEDDDGDDFITAPDEFDVRRYAFDTAVELYGASDEPAAPEEIVQAARVFEDYLNGA